jgi:hypothetical protein
VLTGANKGRLAGQQGVAATSTIKTALTVAALGTTAYARVLGRKLEHAGDVPVEGGTPPTPPLLRRWPVPSGSSPRCSG